MLERNELLRRARELYGTGEHSSLESVINLLESFGAKPVDFTRYSENLVDEFVERVNAVGAWSIFDPDLLQSRASREEQDIFTEDSDEPFGPNEYGTKNAEWTTWSHELNTLQRAIIVLESSVSDPTSLGNFRVYGGAQWLRETIWAASGVVPRDPGSADESAALFGDAFELEGRERFAAFPVNN